MFRVSVKNVIGRFWTLVLTALAVVLGTAFVAGALVFTSSIDRTFSSLFDTSSAGTDVVVRGVEGAGSAGFGDGRAPLPLTLADDLEQVDGVTKATPIVFGLALIVGADGTAVRNGQAPGFGQAYSTDDANITLVDGRAPQGPEEIVAESLTLERSGLSVGDTTKLLAGTEPVDVTIVGEVKQETASLGATFVYLDAATAESYFAPDGTVSEIDLAGDGSLSQTALVGAVATALPDTAEAVTQAEVTQENEDALGTALGFVNTFLLVVAAVSLLVGAFIIANVFSMLLARRTRELALLRAVGASGRQVLASVLVEAIVVGLIGSALGLGLGLLVALGLQTFVSTLGFEISGGLPVDARTVIVTLLVGLIVTVVSAVLPAVRASRVAPVAALRDDVALPAGQVRIRAAVGLVLAGIGVTLLLLGLFVGVPKPLYFVGGGVLGMFFGVAIAAPAIARPVIWLISVPTVAVWGAVGRLARQNSLRNPRRTAATASALMIGTALVGAAVIVTSSVNASLAETVRNDLTAQYVLSSGQTAYFPTSVATDAAELEGVDLVVPTRPLVVELALDGGPSSVGALAADLGEVRRVIDVNVSDGDAGVSGPGDIAVSRPIADENGWQVGDVVSGAPGTLPARDFTITSIYEDTPILGVSLIVDPSVYAEAVPPAEQLDNQLLVLASPDADLGAVRSELTDLVKPYIVISVLDAEEFTSQATNAVSQVLAIISALLGLSIFVALIGIVITLVLSVIERRREIGLLRAVGLTQVQLRRTVTLEGVATSVFGALLGIALGVVFGLSLQRALRESGLDTLSVPYLTLAVFVLAGALVGILASAVPAFWASKRNVLESIATE